jgi:hypothetical protein
MSKKTLKLDLLDKKLLYELDIDARQPLTKLSKNKLDTPSIKCIVLKTTQYRYYIR